MKPAGAAAENEDNNSPSPASLSRTRAATMCVLSLLFAWLATLALCHIPAGGGKEDDDHLASAAAVVQGLSPLFCAYLFSLTAATQGVKDSGTAFLRATCLLLLAAAAARLVDPSTGAAAMFLATVHSAATLGGAVAVRRQRAGTEVAAAAAAMSTIPYRSRAEEENVQCMRIVVFVSVVIVVAVEFASMTVAMWSEPDQGKIELVMLMVFAGPLLVVMQQLMLYGNPLQVEACKFVVSLVVGIIGWIVAMVVANVVVGGNALGIVIWAGALAMAGFFGYGRAVEAEYELLMAAKRSEPRTPQDNSGLLVGRDEEDACSAHIDASTSICMDCAVPAQPKCHC